MHKTIFDQEAREKIKKGVDTLADMVKVTYGAKGQNVILGRPHMLPYITKDGVTVAKEIELNDPIENLGAYLIKTVATKTDEAGGDGTSTATILAQAIVNEVHNSTANPIYLKRGIDKATDFAVKELKKISKKANTTATLKNIATISANGDKEIGNLISEIYKKLGKDGIARVEEGQTVDTFVEYVKGYEVDNGFLSWSFINNHNKLQVEYEDCFVLLYEGYLETLEELNETVQSIVDEATGKMGNLVVISDNIDTNVLNSFITFSNRGQKITAIKSPSFGSKRTETMQDLAVAIGAKVYSKEKAPLNTVTLDGLGKVTKFVADANRTLLIGGKGDKKQIEERTEIIKEQYKTVKGKKEKDYVKERLAKIQGSIAVINVGGYSDVEIREKIDRVDDALGATKASLEEGFVAGGGVTYLYLSEALKTLKLENSAEQEGVEIIRKSLEYPFKQVLSNAKIESEDYMHLIKTGEYGFGVNVDTEKFVNMFKEGIIDPAKITRMALENASSVSSTFLSTGGIVWRDEEIISEKTEM